MVDGNVGLAFGLVVAAGLCTSVGATLAFCVRVSNLKVLSCALGISAGVMIYVSLVEIFSTKAIDGFVTGGLTDKEAHRYATVTLFGGMVFTWVLDRLVHGVMLASDTCGKRRRDSVQNPTVEAHTERAAELPVVASAPSASAAQPTPSGLQHRHHAAGDLEITVPQPRVLSMSKGGPSNKPGCDTPDSVTAHVSGVFCPEQQDEDRHHPDIALPQDAPPVVFEMVKADGCNHHSLRRMSLLSALAVGIHNLPEGLATFVGTIADPRAGIAIAVAIALHNIPEGIVVAMPIYYATGSRWQGFFWSTISGVSEILGGVVGYIILRSNVNDPPIMYAIIFGIVAGMMVYISVQELIPTALAYDAHNHYTSRCVMVGMAVMAGSLILFQV